MTHLIAQKDGKILFSTAMFFSGEAEYILPIEQLVTKFGLVIPSSMDAIVFAHYWRNGKKSIPSDDLIYESGVAGRQSETPGMLLGDGLIWLLKSNSSPKSADDLLTADSPHFYGDGIAWTYVGGDVGNSTVHGNVARGILAGVHSLEEMLEVMTAKWSVFDPRGYEIYDIAILTKWVHAHRSRGISYLDYIAEQQQPPDPAVASDQTIKTTSTGE